MSNYSIEDKIKQAASYDTPNIQDRILAQYETNERRSFNWFRPVKFASAFLFLLFIGVFSLFYFNDPAGVSAYSTITIDINPSIVLHLDEDDNVIEVIPKNDDAEDFLNTLTIDLALPYDDIIDSIVTHAIDTGYITEDTPYIMVNVYHPDSDKQSMMMNHLDSKIPDHAKERIPNFEMIRGHHANPHEDNEDTATENNLTMMDYRMIQSILSLSDDYTFDELKTYSRTELIQLLQNLEGRPGGGPPHNRP